MTKVSVQKRTRHGKTTKHKPRQNRSRQAKAALTVRIGQETIKLTRGDLASPDILDEIARKSEETDGNLQFEFLDLLSLTDPQRYKALEAIQKIQRSKQVCCRRNASYRNNLFDAVLTAVEGDQDVKRFEHSKRAALEAVALVHPDAIESACRKVLKRFQSLGVKGLRLAGLVKSACSVAGQSGDLSPDDQIPPTTAARMFLDHLRESLELPDVASPVWYYREELFVWQKSHWQCQQDKRIFGALTRFLQQRVGTITERYVRDVFTNLKGMCMLDCWDLQMPIWVKESNPLEAVKSPFVVFRNGIVDLHKATQAGGKAKLRKLNPRNFSTIALPYDFVPDAGCPLWQKTLKEIFPRSGRGDRRVRLLQEFFGYALLADNTRLHKFLILVGDGSNGKSTILRVLEELLGQDNVSHVPLEQFGGNFRIYEMAGKLANIAGDMNRVEKVEEGYLKSLTSGDPVQADRKFKDPVTLRPTAKLIFAANQLPPINDRSDGVWRRMIAMPFLATFRGKSCDIDRVDHLMEELPGIFNWALEGARRLLERGRFTCCKVCQGCLNEHRYHTDPFLQFIQECCDLGNEFDVESQHIYKVYAEYCQANGRKATNSSEFGKRVLGLKGVKKHRPGGNGKRTRAYRGITLHGSLPYRSLFPA